MKVYIIKSDYWDNHTVSYWSTRETAEKEKIRLEIIECKKPTNTIYSIIEQEIIIKN